TGEELQPVAVPEEDVTALEGVESSLDEGVGESAPHQRARPVRELAPTADQSGEQDDEKWREDEDPAVGRDPEPELVDDIDLLGSGVVVEVPRVVERRRVPLPVHRAGPDAHQRQRGHARCPDLDGNPRVATSPADVQPEHGHDDGAMDAAPEGDTPE